MRHLDKVPRTIDAVDRFTTLDKFDQDAYEFVSGKQARAAFDIAREDAKTRDAFGRHTWGQSALLARRLLSALLNDLTHRGLFESTLVILCGEFSRTPRMNDGGNGGLPRSMGTAGRDHWGDAMFCLLAGGGIRGGQVIGSTDAKGHRPVTRPVGPENIHATIYKLLGVDPRLKLFDHNGRPTPILDDPTPIDELI
jgi:hypothetical protein